MDTFSDHHISYLYFIRTDFYGEFGLINVHLFDILLAILSGKGQNCLCLKSGNTVKTLRSILGFFTMYLVIEE